MPDIQTTQWANVKLAQETNTRTLRFRLYGEDEVGFQKDKLHFLRPDPFLAHSEGMPSDDFNTLSFSTNGTFGDDNGDIKYFWYGQDNSGFDTTTGYFDLPGDKSLDHTNLNDNIIESLAGCSFSVPVGAPTGGSASGKQGFHDIELSLMVSNEENDFIDIANFPRPRVVVTIWRSYPGNAFDGSGYPVIASSEVVGGTSGNSMRFRLVGTDVGYLLEGSTLQYTVGQPQAPNDAGSIMQYTYRKKVPVYTDSTLEDRRYLKCKYMIGLWVVNSAISPFTLVPGMSTASPSINWPGTGASVNYRVSVIADVNVTYNPIVDIGP